MRGKKNIRDSIQAIQRQLGSTELLRELPFYDPKYEEWRVETGRILAQVFGKVGSEEHPCTKAFLNYGIPERFAATREQMQGYYRDIIQYQTDLLKMYLEDIQDWDY